MPSMLLMCSFGIRRKIMRRNERHCSCLRWEAENYTNRHEIHLTIMRFRRQNDFTCCNFSHGNLSLTENISCLNFASQNDNKEDQTLLMAFQQIYLVEWVSELLSAGRGNTWTEALLIFDSRYCSEKITCVSSALWDFAKYYFHQTLSCVKYQKKMKIAGQASCGNRILTYSCHFPDKSREKATEKWRKWK